MMSHLAFFYEDNMVVLILQMITRAMVTDTYVILIYLRTKAIIQNLRYFNVIRFFVYSGAFLVGLYGFNSILYGIVDYNIYTPGSPTFIYLQIQSNLSNLNLLILDLIFGYQLLKYRRESQKINSPNSATYDILVKYCLRCTILFFATMCCFPITIVLADDIILQGVMFVVINGLILTNMNSFVQMKYDIVFLQKKLVSQNKNPNQDYLKHSQISTLVGKSSIAAYEPDHDKMIEKVETKI